MREDEIDALLNVMGIDLSPFDENAEFAKPRVDDYLGDGDMELPIKGEVAVNTDKAYSVDYAKVKGARKASGYTQKKVADIIGMNASNYCQFERGNAGIKKDQLAKAAKLFGIDYEDCFYKKGTYAGSKQQQAAELNTVLPVNAPVRQRASARMMLNAEKKKNLLVQLDGLRQGLAIMVGKENVEPVLAICRSIINLERVIEERF